MARNFLRALNLSIVFFAATLLLAAAGIKIFSDSLFTLFGALFFFIAFWNEFEMMYL
ncbi:MAG: hypothetical protein NUV67_03020 [archaeon]|nr:hypothetical protein [archaeon]